MNLKVGERVRAKGLILDELPGGQGVLRTAQCGDVGEVRGIDGDWATVTFERSGFTTDCHVSEFTRAPRD